MHDDEIKSALTNLHVNRGKTHISLNKPLLILYMLARYWHGKARIVSFKEADKPVTALVRSFGRFQPQTQDALTPFWQMRKDAQVWERLNYEQLEASTRNRNSHDDRPAYSVAIKSPLAGGLTEVIYKRIISDKLFLLDLVFAIMGEYFPSGRQVALLEALGIPDGDPQTAACGRKQFIDSVFEAYGKSCAVCNYSSTFHAAVLCLEVAHIKWPSAKGPDSCSNGLALCTMHKSFFDNGAFTLTEGNVVRVSSLYREEASELAAGGLSKFQGERVFVPQHESQRPRPEYLAWHSKNVFGG